MRVGVGAGAGGGESLQIIMTGVYLQDSKIYSKNTKSINLP